MSGLVWDDRRQAFWIASDQDRALFLWRPGDGLIGGSVLPSRKAEGVAWDPARDILYVVRESRPRLFVYGPELSK